MNLELTFKSVCETIKKQGKNDPTLIDAVDNLLGLALICSPAVLGPAAIALLPTLAVKNELVRIGKRVFEQFTEKKDEEYIVRYETMSTAYGLLVFTSFFDALDAQLPDALRLEINLIAKEKASITKSVLEHSSAVKPNSNNTEIYDAHCSTLVLAFPHPTETLTDQCQKQRALWKGMSQGFLEFVQKLAVWEQADEKKRAGLLAGLDKIEEVAAKRFEAQYFELARKFEDFAVWSNLHSHKNTMSLIASLSKYAKQHAVLSAANERNIDVGFAKLREAVLNIPEILHVEQATEIANSFKKHYEARINEPIIEDKDISDEAVPRLTFPKICDAFVPQAFKVLRKTGKSRRLEDEATWLHLPRRNDLGSFLLSYLSSPYSTEAPLLILGHPGSGKSLLTTILSAQLTSTQFTAIRVPLREVNADADIQTQIEEFIQRVSGVSFDSWIKLRSLFKNCPPVVILDGYDELLQASGKVFASYIMDAKRFQQRQTEQDWPVRIIITSRVTLIDKAAVPVGSTIVRLLEFDKHQRDCWSTIWNKANANFFRDAGLAPFTLPSAQEMGAEKILNLAEQPLLLLMLALYDSEGNQLKTNQGLDRTKLYDSLLRRFVIRERSKEKGFNDGHDKERQKALAIEMQRLGVAALGMYNRRKIHILSSELDEDIAFFQLERPVSEVLSKPLSQADLLLGSFFFVHRSKAQHSSGDEDTHVESTAFEFLHNTFGEFLTADFIIRRAVSQVQALKAAETNDALRSMKDRMLGTADGFDRDWFASLVYTPLFTRPVILDMIREWVPHVLNEYSLSENDFVETLEKIVLNQSTRLLSKREMPQIMRRETAQEGYRVPFGDHPLVGHIAIYSINLVLLRLVAGRAPFDFDESEIASHEDGTRPWDRLIYIWRSWFSLGNLNGLAAVMLAERSGSKIRVTAKNKFQADETNGRLQENYNVALSLGDDISTCIAGFHLFDPTSGSMDSLDKLEKILHSEGLDLGIPALLTKLFVLAQRFDESPDEFVKHSSHTLEQTIRIGRRDWIETVCQIVSRAIERNFFRHDQRFNPKKFFRHIFQPSLAVELAIRDPRSARIIVSLAKKLHDFEWVFEFFQSFLETFENKLHFLKLDGFGSNSKDFPDWLLLLKEFEIASISPRHGRMGPLHAELLDRTLDPHRLLELSQINPEGVLLYLQIIRQLLGGRNFGEFIDKHWESENIARMFDEHHFLDLSFSNPEIALAYIRVINELGNGRHFELQLGQKMVSNAIDRLLDLSHLLELSERNPEGALATIQIVRALENTGYFKESINPRIGQEEMSRTNSRYLLELSERNPKLALAYIQVSRDIRGRGYFKESVGHRIALDVIDRMLNPRHIRQLSEQNPENFLAYIQIFRELGEGLYFKEFAEQREVSEVIDQMFDPRHLLQLSQRNPESALAYLQIIRELGKGSYFKELAGGGRLGRERIDQMLNSRALVELSDRNPDIAFAYLCTLRELDSDRHIEKSALQHVASELIQRILDFTELKNAGNLRIHSLGVWLAFAHLLNSKEASNRLGSAIEKLLLNQSSFREQLSSLPIASLSDLRWLAEQSDVSELRTFVNKLIA